MDADFPSWTGVTKHCLNALKCSGIIVLYPTEKDAFLFFTIREFLRSSEKDCLLISFNQDENFCSLRKGLKYLCDIIIPISVKQDLDIEGRDTTRQRLSILHVCTDNLSKLQESFRTVMWGQVGMVLVDCELGHDEDSPDLLRCAADLLKHAVQCLHQDFCSLVVGKVSFIWKTETMLSLESLGDLNKILNDIRYFLLATQMKSSLFLSSNSLLHDIQTSWCHQQKMLLHQDSANSIKEDLKMIKGSGDNKTNHYAIAIDVLLETLESYGPHSFFLCLKHFSMDLLPSNQTWCSSTKPPLEEYVASKLEFLRGKYIEDCQSCCIIGVDNVSCFKRCIERVLLNHFDRLSKPMPKEVNWQILPGVQNGRLSTINNMIKSLMLTEVDTEVTNNERCPFTMCSGSYCSKFDMYRGVEEFSQTSHNSDLDKDQKSFLIIENNRQNHDVLKLLVNAVIKDSGVKDMVVMKDMESIEETKHCGTVVISSKKLLKGKHNKYDVVMSQDPISNYQAFQDLKSLLKPGGELVVFLGLENDGSERVKKYESLDRMLRDLQVELSSCDKYVDDKIAMSTTPVLKLNRIIQHLSRMASRSLGIEFKATQEAKDTTAVVEYNASLLLPRETFCTDPIEVRLTCDNPKMCENAEAHILLAKVKAATKACLKLKSLGIMDEYFDPSPSIRNNYDLRKEDLKNPKSKKVKDLSGRVGVAKRVPRLWQSSFQSSVASYPLYSIQLTRLKLHDHAKGVNDYIKEDGYKLGFFSVDILPEVPDFILYDRYGELAVRIQKESIIANVFHHDLLLEFNQYLGQSVLKLNMGKFWSSCILLTVLRKNADGELFVDYEYIRNLEQQVGDLMEPRNPPPINVDSLERINDAVIVPLYCNNPKLFYFSAVCTDTTSESDFPDSRKATTFAKYFETTYGQHLSKEQSMISVHYVNKKLTFLSSRSENRSGKRERESSLLLPPELCGIHPIRSHLWKQLTLLPSIFYRLYHFLLIVDFIHKIDTGLPRNAGSMLCQVSDCPHFVVNYNQHKRNQSNVKIITGIDKGLSRCCGTSTQGSLIQDFGNTSTRMSTLLTQDKESPPCLSLLTIALTNSEANQPICNGRLEFLGDSVLQFLMTLELFCHQRCSNQGVLSFERAKLIGNWKLYQLGQRLNLDSVIISEEFEFEHFMHNLKILFESDQIRTDRVFDYCESKGNAEERKEDLAFTKNETCNDNIGPDSLYKWLRPRSIADALESLVGVYFYCSGLKKATFLLGAFGFPTCCIKPEPGGNLLSSDPFCSCQRNPHNGFNKNVDIDSFSRLIGYRFKHPCLFEEAFTYQGYPPELGNNGRNNKRLELLGDSILALLVTSYLFLSTGNLSSGDMTTVRSGVVDTRTFATLAALNGFHKYLKFTSSTLFTFIISWVEEVEKARTQDRLWDRKVTCSSIVFDEDSKRMTEVPKAMANVFEAVVAAIYLDSNYDLDRVWTIFGPMLRPVLEYYSKRKPKSPVQTLNEIPNLNPVYRELEASQNGKYMFEVNVPGYGIFQGEACIKKAAKVIAAERALAAVGKATE